MRQTPQTVPGPGVSSSMVVVGIERRPDGVLVVHAPAPEGSAPQMVQATTPDDLWNAVQGVLNDPDLPQITLESPQTVSLEQALGAMAGDLLGNLVRTTVPTAAPYVQQVATVVARQAVRKAGGLAATLGKADIPIPRYPRGA